ncbi:MAG TPA: gamma-glutamyl-gamma-aminobutyrate hydrolase family protein [Wenzhouxiangellaceae bacterium]|nr:gamma-glutamyl-gamma-aminobutyrate hydrolase family protein [Wenzhouxiangellaceae bacterium]
MRPRIGVTGPDRGGAAAWLFSALAVWRAGGRPVRIRPSRKVSIEQLDGLIVGGGADVSPALYGEHRHLPMRELSDPGAFGWRRALGFVLFPLLWLMRRLLTKKHGGLDPARDELEHALIGEAIARSMPMLGICRGMQLINIALDGTLHQSLEGFYDEYPAIRSVLPRKQVELKPGSRLQLILDTREARVNALHRQAIDRLGAGLVAVAREPNGVLQGFEAAGERWLIGVQWHPEYLPQRADQRALFEALVDQATPARTR